jgi:hypothetical protein
MRETERANGYGAWPWRDGGAWITDVRAALRAWLQVPFAVRTACFAQHTQMKVKICEQTGQEHKRELGFLGQRQLEQAAAGCSCSTYVVTQRPAATGYPWLCINLCHACGVQEKEKKMYNQV